MYVDSLSKVLLTCVVTLALSACGGGGGGGGSSLIGNGSGDQDADSGASGSVVLSVTGLGDDQVLAGNETATLTVVASESGNSGSLVVQFTATSGSLSSSSQQTTGGEASVELTGDGTGGTTTVTASVTLSDGTELSDSLVIQTSAVKPSLTATGPGGSEITQAELRAGESIPVTITLTDWDGTPLPGVRVTFSTTNSEVLAISSASAFTNSEGKVTVSLEGTKVGGTETFKAEGTYTGANNEEFTLLYSIAVNSLGLDETENYLTVADLDLGANSALDGNEKAVISVTVYEDGAPKDGLVVTFDATAGRLVSTAETTSNGGIASTTLIGDASGEEITLNVSAELSGGATVSLDEPITITTTTVKPSISLSVRDETGASVTSVDANKTLTLEATVVDFDGSPLDEADAGASVGFSASADNVFALDATSSTTAFAVCPVVGIKANADCAFVTLTSSELAGEVVFTASASLTELDLDDASITVTNTGKTNRTPEQSRFVLSRSYQVGADVFSPGSSQTAAIEGDDFSGETITITAELKDASANVVSDAQVDFVTEMGDVTSSCTTDDAGQCEVLFSSSDRGKPSDVKTLDTSSCPSELIIDETVPIGSGGRGATAYRIDEILRVNLSGTTTILTEGTNYVAESSGIRCITCTIGQVMKITYRRLWLDESDVASDYRIDAPGKATAPFLNVTGTPCLAQSRSAIETLTGSVNPTASTSVTGVGTLFLKELAVGDKIRVSGEVRTVATISTNTLLTVDSAFSDNPNDTAPSRISAPAYLGGLGQPYGGRATILASTEGEESFTDSNGNGEYDAGEPFVDLPEAFLDYNEDGVLADIDSDSSVAGTEGPYSDGGTGTDASNGSRDKGNPYCYGPLEVGSGVNSTEHETYCYQEGGIAEAFFDKNGNGALDLGNGIYNGSRCLNPVQGGVTVCTPDLVDIRRQIQVVLAGSDAKTEFRAGDVSTHGANGGGEIISGILKRAGTLAVTIPPASSWSAANATVTTLDDSFGARVDTSGLDTNFGDITDKEEDVTLFSIADPFPTSDASYRLQLQITSWTTGALEVFVGGTKLNLSVCASATTCVTDVFSGLSGAITVAVADSGVAPAEAYRFVGDINNISVEVISIGASNGISADFRSSLNLTSNDLTDVALTEFNIGNEMTANSVFAGVSERFAPGTSAVPVLTTSLTTGTFWFSDQYNGQLPAGTVIEFDASGCTISPATVTVGKNGVTKSAAFTVASGGSSGTVTATVTTPLTGLVATDTISCNLD